MKAYKPNWTRRATGTEVAKLIRKCNDADRVIVTSFDPSMLTALEREYPGLHSGFAYDDGMQINLDAWFEKINDPGVLNDVISFGTRIGFISGGFAKTVTGIAQWLTSERFVTFMAEMNSLGKLIGSTLVDVEHTLIDEDTIEKFYAKEMAVGTYTSFSTDPGYPDKLTPEE